MTMTFIPTLNIRTLLGLCGLMALPPMAHADVGTDTPTGLIAALSGNQAGTWTHLQDYGVNIGGWAAAGINYNPNSPGNDSNGPVSMTDRSGEFNLYQLNLFIEKAVTKASTWDVGGRFDFLFGTDAHYTQATGDWDMGLVSLNDQYNVASPQAYVEVFAPIGNGLSGKFGHFFSIIGYEAVQSPLNFFSSHTYSFKSSPFTTTGVLFTYPINGQWSINLGAVTGPDNFDRDFGAWSQMDGLTWANAETGTTVSFSVLQGDVYERQNSGLVYYSAILQQELGKWRYVLQHDRGGQQNAIAQGQNAEWYSIVQYLTYQATDTLGVGLRGEWFRDNNGFRYTAGVANYYDLTVGVNWKPNNWLMLRPEVRYDWSQAQIDPFSGGSRSDQILLGIDAVIQF